MYTTDIAKERIPEKVTLEFAKRLVEIVNDDPDDFNSYYLNACYWEDLLRFFIKLYTRVSRARLICFLGRLREIL